MGIVFVSVLHAQIFPRFDRTTIEYEGSVSERVQSLYDAKTVMDATSLFFGTGAGNFTERLLWLEGERPVWTLQPVHNVVVLILAEIGVIGLFLWFVFLGTILLSWKKYLTSLGKGHIRSIFVLALLVLLPSLLLDHWLWSSHFGIFFSFLLLGLSYDGDEESV
jgi:O-antigen ligase